MRQSGVPRSGVSHTGSDLRRPHSDMGWPPVPRSCRRSAPRGGAVSLAAWRERARHRTALPNHAAATSRSERDECAHSTSACPLQCAAMPRRILCMIEAGRSLASAGALAGSFAREPPVLCGDSLPTKERLRPYAQASGDMRVGMVAPARGQLLCQRRSILSVHGTGTSEAPANSLVRV